MNRIILKGRLVADPELRQTTSNISVCRFSIAVDKYTKDDQKAADFIRCIAWRNQAEFISKFFAKGKEICLEGSLHNADYTDKNNVKHFSYEVMVDRAEFCGSRNDTAPAATSEAIPNANGWAEYEQVLNDQDVPF